MSNNPLTTKEDPGKEKIECIKKGVCFSAEFSKMCQPVVASRWHQPRPCHAIFAWRPKWMSSKQSKLTWSRTWDIAANCTALALYEPMRALAIRVPSNKANPTPFKTTPRTGHVVTSTIFLCVCTTSGTLLTDPLNHLFRLCLPPRSSGVFRVHSIVAGWSSSCPVWLVLIARVASSEGLLAFFTELQLTSMTLHRAHARFWYQTHSAAAAWAQHTAIPQNILLCSKVVISLILILTEHPEMMRLRNKSTVAATWASRAR